MKSLRQTRKDKGMSMADVQRQLGINNVQLFDMETGKHSPLPAWRTALENFYGQKIDFLDVPIDMSPREDQIMWVDAEREFRYFVHMVASLPEDEKPYFIDTVIKQLNKLKENGK